MMNFYTYNGVEYKDEQLYSLENQIKDQLEKCKAEGNSDDARIAELEKQVEQAGKDLKAEQDKVSKLTEEAKVKDEKIAELEAQLSPAK